MKKFLNFQEYNTIHKAIINSSDYCIYGVDKKKEFYDTLFNKLFTIKENDLLSNEAINHPIEANS